MTTKYYIVRTTSNIDAAPIESFLTSEFKSARSKAQDGLAVALHGGSSVKDWADHVATTPRLIEFVFTAGDILSYLTVGCEDLTYLQVKAIVNTQGGSGVTFSAPSDT